jgi:hypothetical protein
MPAPMPEVRAHRIGIDTAVFAINCLACLVLEGGNRHFITIRVADTLFV